MNSDQSFDAQSIATLASVKRFNEACNRHDVDAVMAAMTDDCIFENTNPAPDGKRYQGQAEVRAFWERFLQNSPDALFEAEESLQSKIAVSSAGSIERRETASRGTCAASISFARAKAKWQKNLLT
jgi:ketosteroid isomerase-like protein